MPFANPLVIALATKAAPNAPIILFLLAIDVADIVFKAPVRLPPIASWIADAAPVELAKLNAVPASIAEMLKDFFARLRDIRLLTILPQLNRDRYTYGHGKERG